MCYGDSLYSVQYSVMQSDGNSFCRDVVLNSFGKASRDEESILDQLYKKQISPDLYYNDFQYFMKMHINITEALKLNFMRSLL